MKTHSFWLGGCAALAAVAVVPQVLAQGAGTKSPAVYWMSAETSAGMMAGATGSAGVGAPRPSMGSMLGGLLGGRGGASAPSRPPSYSHLLHLQLAGNQRPGDAPGAEHVPPAGLQTGTLPLESPRPSRREPSDPVEYAKQMGKPQGRMLIYWGCGEHAPAGQPVVIDFANLAAGKAPPAFASGALPVMTPPSPSSAATYGEWPNARSNVTVPASGKLAGAHVVRGNYAPQIQFTLGADQDFMAPVVLDSQSPASSGAVPLVWHPIAGAKAWMVTTMGATRKGDVVLWTSATSQVMAMGLDYVPQDSIPGLIQKGTLLPASATQCTVPAEVAKAAEGTMLRMVALGGEANFSYPVRPKNAPANWQPDWVTKARFKSTYGGLLGMDLAAMMSGRD